MNKKINAKNVEINEHRKNSDYKVKNMNAEAGYKTGIIRAGNNRRASEG